MSSLAKDITDVDIVWVRVGDTSTKFRLIDDDRESMAACVEVEYVPSVWNETVSRPINSPQRHRWIYGRLALLQSC
jgi:hypothetical protein